MELILVFVGGFLAGKLYAYYKIVGTIKELAEEHGIDLSKELDKLDQKEQEPGELIYKLQVEKHGDLLYLFDKDSDEFICQGSSVQELAKLSYSLKKIEKAAVLYNETFFKFVNGESTQV